jgi:hypothetical protein
MAKYIILLFTVSLFLSKPARGQELDQLNTLSNYASEIYYSTGHEKRAVLIAGRVDRAMVYYQGLLGFKPEVTLLILSPSDWTKYTKSGAVYGMPHYLPGSKVLVVAAEDNPFWKSFLPPLDKLPAGLRDQIQTVYKNENGSLSMQAFFDLLAIHELGHAFNGQAGLKMQRNWMGELYVNILLHTYIAENEPELLPALTVFPQMVIAGGAKDFKYTSLNDVETKYNEIGRDHPRNYGWYQCRWHAAAGRIYDAAGKQVNRKIWDALKNKARIETDEELAAFLETHADKSLADMIRNWDAVK